MTVGIVNLRSRENQLEACKVTVQKWWNYGHFHIGYVRIILVIVLLARFFGHPVDGVLNHATIQNYPDLY